MDADRENPQPSGHGTPAVPGTLNPAALTVADVARLLTAAGGHHIPPEAVQAAIDAGAPVLADGRLNLVELMAWLEKELGSSREH
jgi:polygalacturonase